MYLAYGRMPYMWDWDLANATTGDVSTIEIASTKAGR